MIQTKCECPVAGYCQRHQVRKNQHWHYLCQTRSDYFDAYEAGRGPGQKQATEMNVKAKPTGMRGLGDLVAAGLSAVGIKKRSGCGCGKRQAWLNRMVPFGKGDDK